MVPLERLPKRGLLPSERQLCQAFEWFAARIGAHVGMHNARQNAHRIH
jgi:hypothetical protein